MCGLILVDVETGNIIGNDNNHGFAEGNRFIGVGTLQDGIVEIMLLRTEGYGNYNPISDEIVTSLEQIELVLKRFGVFSQKVVAIVRALISTMLRLSS